MTWQNGHSIPTSKKTQGFTTAKLSLSVWCHGNQNIESLPQTKHKGWHCKYNLLNIIAVRNCICVKWSLTFLDYMKTETASLFLTNVHDIYYTFYENQFSHSRNNTCVDGVTDFNKQFASLRMRLKMNLQEAWWKYKWHTISLVKIKI